MTQKKLGVVVVLKKKFIMGLITDGDLRREIKFKDISKNKNLLNFITKNPLVVNENMPAQKALAIMNEKQITSLLIVADKDLKKSNKTLKGIIHIHQLLQSGIK
jgi:arabinose-5-phosphate isomerase